MKVNFVADSFSFDAEFNDTITAKEIVGQLPREARVSRWGDEIYFDLGVKVSAKDATMQVAVGDVGYWPQGKCLCVFFGPTPASNSDKPVPASPVVIVGRTKAAVEDLKKIELGEKISVSRRPKSS